MKIPEVEQPEIPESPYKFGTRFPTAAPIEPTENKDVITLNNVEFPDNSLENQITQQIGGFDAFVSRDAGNIVNALNYYYGIPIKEAQAIGKMATKSDAVYAEVAKNPDEWERYNKRGEILDMLWKRSKEKFVPWTEEERKKEYRTGPGHYEQDAANPLTIKFLSHPDKMAQYKEPFRIATLQKIEELTQSYYKSQEGVGTKSMNALSMFGLDMQKKILQFPALALSAANFLGNTMSYYTGRPENEVPEYVYDNFLTKKLDKYSEEIAPPELSLSIIDEAEKGNFIKAGASIWYQALRNAPQQAIILGAYLMKKPALGLAMMGATEAIGSYVEAKKSGKGELMSLLNGIADGGIGTLLEIHGSLGMFKHMEKQLINRLGKVSAYQIMKDVAVNAVIVGGGTEGLEELTTSLGQDLANYLTEGKDAFKDYKKRALEAGIVGAVSGMAMVAPMGSLSGMVKYQKAQDNISFYRKLLNTLDKTKIKEDTPESTAEFINENLHAAKIDPIIKLKKEDLDTIFEDNPEEEQAFIDTLAINKDEEGELEVSLSAFAVAYAGSPIGNEIVKFIRFDGKTLAELTQEHEDLVLGQKSDSKASRILIDYYKKNDNGRRIYEELEHKTLQDEVNLFYSTDGKEGMSMEDARQLAIDHDHANTPLSNLVFTGSNKLEEATASDGVMKNKDFIKHVIKISKTKELTPAVIEDTAEAWLKEEYGNYDRTSGEFGDKAFNDLLDKERLKAEDKGYKTSQDRMEWIGQLIVNRVLDPANAAKLEQRYGFSKKFVNVIKKMATFLNTILERAKKTNELIANGTISTELVDVMDKAVKGELDSKYIDNLIEQDPTVQEAEANLKESVDQVEELEQSDNKAETYRLTSFKEFKENFENPVEDKIFNSIPEYILNLLKKPIKPLILKKNIIEKNKAHHADLNVEESFEILNRAIGNPVQIIQTKPNSKPNYYTFIGQSEKKQLVNIELSLEKDNYEIIGWYFTKEEKVNRLKRKVVKEGGQILIAEDIKSSSAVDRLSDVHNLNNIIADEDINFKPESETYRLSNANTKVLSYIKIYDAVQKHQDVFNKFGANEYSQEAETLKNKIVKDLELVTNTPRKGDVIDYIREIKKNAGLKVYDSKNKAQRTIAEIRADLKRIKENFAEQQKLDKSFDRGYKHGGENMRESIVNLQKEIEPLLKKLPLKERGRFFLAQRQLSEKKTLKAQQKQLTKIITRMENILDAVERKTILSIFDTMFKSFLPSLTKRGEQENKRLTVETMDTVQEIYNISKLDSEQYDSKMTQLEELENMNVEDDREDYLYRTFGQLQDKSTDDLRKALVEFKKIIEFGLGERKQIIEKRAAFITKLKLMVENDARKGADRGLDEKEIVARKEKQKKLLNKIADFSKGYADSHIAFELLMNQLGKKTRDEFALREYEAMTLENTIIRERRQEFNDFIKKLFAGNIYKSSLGYRNFIKEVDTDIELFTTQNKKHTISIEDANKIIDNYVQGKSLEEFKDIYIDEQVIDSLEEKLTNLKTNKDGSINKQQKKITFTAIQYVNPYKIKLSQAQAVHYYQALFQHNYKRNMLVNGWTEDSIKALEAFMTPQAHEVSEWILNKNENYYESKNNVYKSIRHMDLAHTNFYAKVKVDHGENSTVEDDLEKSMLGIKTSNRKSFVNSSTIKRVEHGHSPDKVSALDLYMQGVYEDAHYIAYANLSLDLNAVFKSPDIIKAIKETTNPKFYNEVSTSIDNIILGGNGWGYFKFLEKLKNFTSLFYLSWKVINLPKQLMSFGAAWGKMPTNKFFEYTAKFYEPNKFKENYKWTIEQDYIKNRMFMGFTQAQQGMYAEILNNPSYIAIAFMKLGMKFTKYGDIFPTIQTYHSAYNYWMNEFKGMPYEDRMERATNEAIATCELTQQPMGKAGRGTIQDAAGTLGRFAQMFQSAQRIYFGNTYNALLALTQNKEGSKQQFIKSFLIYQVLMPIMFYAVADLFNASTDDDWEFEAEDYLFAILASPLSGLFLTGAASNFGIRTIMGLNVQSLSFAGGSGKLIENLVRAGSDLTEGDWLDALEHLTKQSGFMMTIKQGNQLIESEKGN